MSVPTTAEQLDGIMADTRGILERAMGASKKRLCCSDASGEDKIEVAKAENKAAGEFRMRCTNLGSNLPQV